MPWSEDRHRGRQLAVDALLWALLALVLWLPGCAGGGGVSVGPSLDDDPFADAVAETQLLAADADAAVAVLDVDTASEDVLSQVAGVNDQDVTQLVQLGAGPSTIDDLDPAGGLAPAFGGLRPQAVDDRQRTSETYTGGRTRRIQLVERYEDDVRDRMVFDAYITYSSTVTPTGDLNDAATVAQGGPHAYVYARITATVEFRDNGRGDLEPATITGFRHWHSGRAVEFLVFDLTTTLPAHDRAPFASQRWRGDYGETGAGVGSFLLDVVFGDGERDTRTWTISRDGATLAMTYSRLGPGGVQVAAEGSTNHNGTPECRLDDRGAMTIARTFPSETTSEPVPLTDTVTTTISGQTTTVDQVLRLSDGTTRTRTQRRDVLVPASCDDDQSTRTVRVEATSYANRTVTMEVTREAGAVTLYGSRTTAAGRIDLEGVLATGLLDLTIERTVDTSDDVAARLSLQLDQSGRGSGTLARFRPRAGTQLEQATLQRDVRGRMTVEQRGSGPEPKTQRERLGPQEF